MFTKILDTISDAKTHILSTQEQKTSGSYYTEIDVARHVWLLMQRQYKFNKDSFIEFCKAHEFIEPSVGSGVFIFTLYEYAYHLGVPLKQFKHIKIQCCDVNLKAIDYVRDTIKALETQLNVSLSVTYHHGDFLRWAYETSSTPFYMGNPPFISDKNSMYKNIYGDFLEHIFQRTKYFALIVPLSISFSAHMKSLRMMLSDTGFSATHYDNIPDALFKSKNSQRCTILISSNHKQESSRLMRWFSHERTHMLKSLPYMYDVTDVHEHIPRYSTQIIYEYMQQGHIKTGRDYIDDSVSKDDKYVLFIGRSARNYISIREEAEKNICLRARDMECFYHLLSLLTSRLFYEYWLSFGDGFHVSEKLIKDFPITEEFEAALKNRVQACCYIWKHRQTYMKIKKNAGREYVSFDFEKW